MKLIVLDRFNVEAINENFRMIAEALGDIEFGSKVEEFNQNFAAIETRLNQIGVQLSEI